MHCYRRVQASECPLMNDKTRTIGYWIATSAPKPETEARVGEHALAT